MKTTRVFTATVEAYLRGYRVIPNRGGTRSGKTFSMMQFLILKAASKRVNIDVVSESVPHLKRGCMQDFESITEALGMIEDVHFTRNRTDNCVTFNRIIAPRYATPETLTGNATPETGGTIRFFSADDWGKIKGSRREILFLNECNRLPFEVFRQLEVRTTECIFLDWNPDSEFWFEQQGVKTRPDTAPEIVSTYLDNIENLTPQQIASIEANKNDTNWWRVYGLGQVGKKQGLIYKNWEMVRKMPKTYKFRGLGIDWGVNDPTAIIDFRFADGEIWLDELYYLSGKTNRDVEAFLQANKLQGLPIIADSADANRVLEMQRKGYNITPANKPNGSIQYGIDVLRRYKMNITDRSLNLLDEIRHYCWQEDALGNPLNKPIDKYNHALDAVRYVAMHYLAAPPKTRRGCRRAELV